MRPDYIEIDIGVTKDNKIILLHDPDLERTTNGKGWVRDKTRKKIKELRLKNTEGKITSTNLKFLKKVRKSDPNIRLGYDPQDML